MARSAAAASALAFAALVALASLAGASSGENVAEAACTADSSDADCHAYWEGHINWFSWDYKPGDDQAAEHRHMPPPFAFAMFNFAVFAWIMMRLAKKPLVEFVRTRHLTIRTDLDEAAALHRKAEERLRLYESRIAGIDKEVADLIAQVKRDAAAQKDRIIANAEKQAERIKADAEAQIRSEMREVRRELRLEAVNAAIAAAQDLLTTQTTSADQARLTDRFVAAVESTRLPSSEPQLPGGPAPSRPPPVPPPASRPVKS